MIVAAYGIRAGLKYGGPLLSSVPYQIMLQGAVFGMEVVFISPVVNAIDHYFEGSNNQCVAIGDAHQAADEIS